MFDSTITAPKAITKNVVSTGLLDDYIKNILIQIEKHTSYRDNTVVVERLINGFIQSCTLMKRLVDVSIIQEYEKQTEHLQSAWENKKQEVKNE